MSTLRRRILTAVDKADHALGKVGLFKRATFRDIGDRSPKALYAGRLSRHLPQFASSYVGMTPFFPSSRNIGHDVTAPLPLPDDYLDLYQSEDVFEHIEYDKLLPVFDEIHRVLKPGGIFRLSLPDYNFDLYAERCQRDQAGEILFDPGGGGSFRDGRVVDGGHLWFPTFALVKDLFDRSKFGSNGDVEFLHYAGPSDQSVMKPIDFGIGYVQRVPGNDERVADRPRPISIVVDARKKG